MSRNLNIEERDFTPSEALLIETLVSRGEVAIRVPESEYAKLIERAEALVAGGELAQRPSQYEYRSGHSFYRLEVERAVIVHGGGPTNCYIFTPIHSELASKEFVPRAVTILRSLAGEGSEPPRQYCFTHEHGTHFALQFPDSTDTQSPLGSPRNIRR